jgi:hypothetical protein
MPRGLDICQEGLIDIHQKYIIDIKKGGIVSIHQGGLDMLVILIYYVTYKCYISYIYRKLNTWYI